MGEGMQKANRWHSKKSDIATYLYLIDSDK